MMNINSVKIVIFSSLVVMLASCSGYNKLLKSGDTELIYKTALDYFEKEKYSKVITLLTEVGHVYVGTEREDSIFYYSATSFYKSGDMTNAGALFDEFRRKYPRSVFIERSEHMYAKSFYYSSPDPDRDQAATVSAIFAIGEFLDRYPNSVEKETLLDNVEELTFKLHDKSFLNAKTYYKIGRYKSAVIALKNASMEYPESRHLEELFFLVLKSHYLYASNSYEHLQRDRYLDMMDAYYTFVSDYPESKSRKEADKMMAVAEKYIAQFKEATVVKAENDEAKGVEKSAEDVEKGAEAELEAEETAVEETQE